VCVVTVCVHEEGTRVTIVADHPTRVACVGGATEAVVFVVL
jgi:ABC-type Fe3+-hydroxamate transport system substrate-binding protein